jgi:hypothetical protein
LTSSEITELRGTFVFIEPTFASFDAAVGASQRSARAARGRRDTATMLEERIVGFRIGADTVELLLSGSRVLVIFCDGDTVDWRINERPALPATPRIYADEVVVTMAGGTSRVWKPYAVLESLMRGPRAMVLPSLTLVFVAAGGSEEIMFSQMIDAAGVRRIHFGAA